MRTALVLAASLFFATPSFASEQLHYRVSLEDASANWHSFSDYRGKVLLIDTVGAACGWTDREQPGLRKLYDELHPKGLEIVTVVEGTASYEDMKEYVTRNGIPWKVLRSDDVSFTSVFIPRGSIDYPTNFLVSRSGVRTKLGVNRSPAQMERVRAAVEEALAEKAPATLAPIDAQIPASTFTGPDGKPTPARDLAKGPAVYVFFHNNSCDQAAKAVPAEAAAAWAKAGVRVIGVDTSGDSGELTRQCLEKTDIEFPIFRAKPSEPRSWFGSDRGFGIAFVDRSGSIIAFSGLPTTHDGELEKRAFAAVVERLVRK